MSGVLAGFATIGAVIGVGFLLAQLRVLDQSAQVVLSRVAFFVASPALLVTVLGDTDVTHVLSRNLVAIGCGVVVSGALYVAVARLVWHKPAGETVIGTLCACYSNAGNLGLPIAAYVLGDAAQIAPLLLLQLLVLQPVALSVLDTLRVGPGVRVWAVLRRPLTNPLTIGSVLGVALSLTGWRLPSYVDDPLRLVGGMAVPAMLIAFGVSLRLGPRPGAGPGAAEIGLVTGLKLVVQPVTAYAVGALLGLDDFGLLAVTVIAALPTAQNIFVHATRYGRAELLARDSIFVTTILSVPALFLVAALLA